MCVHFCLLATSVTTLESVELQLPCPVRTSLRLWTNSNLALASMDSTTLAEVSVSGSSQVFESVWQAEERNPINVIGEGERVM